MTEEANMSADLRIAALCVCEVYASVFKTVPPELAEAIRNLDRCVTDELLSDEDTP